jgi:hypothetical protein
MKSSYKNISHDRDCCFRNRKHSKGKLELLEEMQFHVSLERHVVDHGILFRLHSHSINHFVNLMIQIKLVYKLTWPNRYFRK